MSTANLQLIDECLSELQKSDLSEQILKIKSFKVRQDLARQIYSKFGWQKWKLSFSKTSEDFVATRTEQEEECVTEAEPMIEKVKQDKVETEMLLKYELGFSLVI